jgi:hypothetical protein
MIQEGKFAEKLHQNIAAAYNNSENTFGWRLLASPAAVLDEAEIAFIGLNPGGSIQRNDHGEFAMVRGSAYEIETWDRSNQPGMNPLQKQVRELFRGLSVEPEKVLAGNLVPFRSPSWKLLRNKESSLQFGESIWAEILNRSKPSLVIGMGREVLSPLSRILGATNSKTIPVGWGKISAVQATFRNGSLVILPHLSRFGIVTRSKSANALKTLFEERWKIR